MMGEATPQPGVAIPGTPTGARPRFLSAAECHDIAERLIRAARGGGVTTVTIWGTWTGNVRWARNRVASSGDVRNDVIRVTRTVRGAFGHISTNDLSARGLIAALRQAERCLSLATEAALDPVAWAAPEPLASPQLFSEATYQLDDAARAALARRVVQGAEAAGMFAAGYAEVAARCIATIDSTGRERYFPFTQAEYSVTVRDPKGTGSGWAGVDHHDWAKIDGEQLSAIALDKCLKSRNPVRLEPGRYPTILEPQAVADLVRMLVTPNVSPVGDVNGEIDRSSSEFVMASSYPPFWRKPEYSKLGEKVIDERFTLSADPSDPDLGFPPFDPARAIAMYPSELAVFHPATWIKDGVLTGLAYGRDYAITELGRSTGLPNSGSFRLSANGPGTPIEEMIEGTKRGLLVSRFDNVLLCEPQSVLCTGFTRDGLWLIENGKISQAIKNFRFTDSPLFALNSVEQIGPSRRVFNVRRVQYHPWETLPRPVMVPALKLREFSFTALSDAV